MTTTETTGAELSIFDFDAHRATGEALRTAHTAALADVARAEHVLSDATEAEEDLDLASDTNSKITKVRLDLERAEAIHKQANAALRSAERRLAKHNDDTELAEALLPLADRLAGRHPGFRIHTLPAEPDWSAVPAASLVLVQQREALRNDGGSLTTTGKPGEGILLGYVADAGYHRDLISGEAVVDAARRSSVGLGKQGGQPVKPSDLKVQSKPLSNGLTLTTVELQPYGVFAPVPLITTVDTSRPASWLATVLVSEIPAIGVVPGQFAHYGPRPLVQVEDMKPVKITTSPDGTRTVVATLAARAVSKFDGSLLDDETAYVVERLSGRAVGSVGRITSATYSAREDQVVLSFTSCTR